MVLRSVRDILDDDVGQIIVDNPIECERIQKFIDTIAPERKNIVKLR